MPIKNEVERVKSFHKDKIREFSQLEPDADIYAYYFFGDNSKRARCYGDLFGYISGLNMDTLSLTMYPLKFNRRLGYFDYNKLFKEMNIMYGNYFKIGRYYSGYRYTRLVHISPSKRPKSKALWWGGLYTIFLMLRKINIHYYPEWRGYFKTHKKPIKTWKDVVLISETEFGDDGYYIHDSLFKKCWSEDKAGARKWIDNYFNMLNSIFGKGLMGDNARLRMGQGIYNTATINGLLSYWESAK